MCVVDEEILRCDSSGCLASVDGLRTVRSTLREYLSNLGVAQNCHADTALVLNELATNALRHGNPPVRLLVQHRGSDQSDQCVWVEVFDAGPDVVTEPSINGYGLKLISALSMAWGVVPADGGKTLWAKLACT